MGSLLFDDNILLVVIPLVLNMLFRRVKCHSLLLKYLSNAVFRVLSASPNNGPLKLIIISSSTVLSDTGLSLVLCRL